MRYLNLWSQVAAASSPLLLLCAGCTTQTAEKIMSKPAPADMYAGFGQAEGKDSERKSKPAEPVSDDMDPEKAVKLLVEQMQRQEPGYYIPAENELRAWGQKQGVDRLVVQGVRPLLKHARIEVRAPALRLTVAFCRKESFGDLIEVLADEEYGMRKTACEALRQGAGRDFGFDPGGGEAARAQGLQRWRAWWQEEQKGAVSGKPVARESKNRDERP